MTKYEVGDPWPKGLDANLTALLVLVCPCGGHVEATGGYCEKCGREFDHQGKRIVGGADLENVDEDGELEPDADPDLA